MDPIEKHLQKLTKEIKKLQKFYKNHKVEPENTNQLDDNSDAIICRPHFRLAGSLKKHDDNHITPFATVYYIPKQIRTAYALDSLGSNGAGITIAIVVAYSYPNAQADLNVFCRQFGIPTTTIISKVMKNYLGQSAPYDAGWSMEASMDIQWSHAMAPSAKIMLVQAYSARYDHLIVAVDYAINNGAHIVSMSWGGSEMSSQTTFNSHFNRPNVVCIASSGDVGSIVSTPSSSPYVLAVGGTSLYLNPDNTRKSEVAWSGSGGGVSKYELAPEYQKTSSLGTSGNLRQVPDVCAVADSNTGVPVYNKSNTGLGQWYIFGGTSLSAPLWAGFIANANELRIKKGKAVLSTWQVQKAIYAVKTTEVNPTNTAIFYDVVIGNSGKFTTKPDYDLVTGIGAPNNDKLISNLLVNV